MVSSKDPAKLYPLQRRAGMLLFVAFSPPSYSSVSHLRSLLLSQSLSIIFKFDILETN